MKTIDSVNEALNVAQKLPSDDWVGGWFYRGQADISWDFSPKIHRPPHSLVTDYQWEFTKWMREASYYPELIGANEFENLAIAQHHGLPTNLLDWSSNILVALFFACRDLFEVDAKLCAYFPTWYITEPEGAKFEDYKKGVVAYQPRTISDRVKVQSGVFTFHFDNSIIIENSYFGPGEHTTLESWLIPSKYKIPILKDLDRLNVNMKSLFPNLDGLCNHYCLMDKINSI